MIGLIIVIAIWFGIGAYWEGRTHGGLVASCAAINPNGTPPSHSKKELLIGILLGYITSYGTKACEEMEYRFQIWKEEKRINEALARLMEKK